MNGNKQKKVLVELISYYHLRTSIVYFTRQFSELILKL